MRKAAVRRGNRWEVKIGGEDWGWDSDLRRGSGTAEEKGGGGLTPSCVLFASFYPTQSSKLLPPPLSEDKPDAPPRKMTVVEVYGDRKAVEIAERMWV